MRLTLPLAATISLLLQSSYAIFADEVGVVDWHYPLLGRPQQDTTFFHQPHAESKASLVYTLSERSVLGAVNPRDGSIVWRQQLARQSNLTASLRTGHTSDTVVSGIGTEVTAWLASDGRQVWSYNIGEGQLRDLEILEIDSGNAASSAKDSVVLVQGAHARVLRLDGSDGRVVWDFKDDSGDSAHQVSASTTQVFYVSLHTGIIGSGLKIKVTALNPATGKRTEQHTLSSDGDVTDASHILAVGANSALPIVAWTDKAFSVLKVNIMGTKAVSSFNIASPAADSIIAASVHGPSNSNSRPHFLVSYRTAKQSWAEVYHVDLKKSSVVKAYDLPKLSEASAFAVTSDGSNVYFTRVSESEVSVVSSASHGILSRWSFGGFRGLPTTEKAFPVQASTELSVRGETVSAARSTVLLSTGDWVLIRDGAVAWTRPEQLADTVIAAHAYPPVAKSKVGTAPAKPSRPANPVEAYINRWTRHIAQLSSIPAFLPKLPDLILSNLGLKTKTTSGTIEELASFGFHKLVICATSTGRLIGLDAGASGRVLWSTQAPSSHALLDHSHPVLKAYPNSVMELRIDEQASPGFFFDGTTGKAITAPTAETSGAKHLDITAGLNGITASEADSTSGFQSWRFTPSVGDKVIGVTVRPPGEPVASVGRVLGDRRVLYKYLNPNLLMLASTSATDSILTVSLLDSSSGDVLYTGTHESYADNLPFAAAVSENWFAYSFTEASGDGESRATQLVVGEMYESSLPDARGSTGNASDQFPNNTPYIPLQTYIIPEPISQLTVSQTSQGITSRELIALLPFSDSIVGIPKAVIDPRRPVGRDPSKTEQYEGLMRYVPNLDFDPKWYLNHKRELLGITNVTTSPALLESTSLVFAYGLDVFGTRVSPSFSFDLLGKDFNKIQMLGTVAALALLTFAILPLVSRKQVNARWTMMS